MRRSGAECLAVRIPQAAVQTGAAAPAEAKAAMEEAAAQATAAQAALAEPAAQAGTDREEPAEPATAIPVWLQLR